MNYLLLILAAIFAAYHSKDKAIAVPAAFALFFNWLIYTSAWTPYAPKHLLIHVGIFVEHSDIWSVTDALTAAFIIATCFMTWWGIAIWALFILQIMLHCLYGDGLLVYNTYNYLLNYSFEAMLACFYVIGGRGVFNWLIVDSYNDWNALYKSNSIQPKA